MQLTHYNSNFQTQLFPITLVCEQVTNAANIGSLFRTADAFGIEKLIFCGRQVPFGRKMTKTARATEKYITHEWHDNIETLLDGFKKSGQHVIALEITDRSTPLTLMTFTGRRAIVLVIGDENFGVSESSLNLCESVIHIDMFGHNSSMNVVQATSIALYEITKQLINVRDREPQKD